MAITCTAVYEQGVLRPQQPLNLQEGAVVEVVVVPKEAQEPLSGRALCEAIMKIAALPSEVSGDDPDNAVSPGEKTIAEVLADIAAMPPEGPQDGFSGQDHDKVLYGEKGAR